MRSRITRRTFGKAAASGSLIMGFSAMTGRWAAADEALRGEMLAELPKLDGELFIDPLTRDEFAQDYGQIIHAVPNAVLRPGSIEDIARIVRFARRFGLRLAARGHGHQPFGQAQVPGGIVIDMRSLDRVHALSSDQIQVDAGAQWREVVRAAASQRLMPPVLPNYLGLTVGGTLSIGGVGLATFRHGAQVDQVLALQVVTGTGDILDCSLTERRDVFEAALAGQGQSAVIVRATLKLQPAPDVIREYTLPYADLRTLLHDGVKLAEDGRFDGFLALLAPMPDGWAYLLTAVRNGSETHLRDAALLNDLHFQRGAEKVRDVNYLDFVDVTPPFDPAQTHADLGLCIPQSAVEPALDEMLGRFTPSDLGEVTAVRVFFWPRAPFTRPLLRIPDEERCCYAAILRKQTSDTDTIARQLAGNRTLYELIRDSGGTLYPFAALAMNRSDWRRHYGEDWGQLMTMKRRYDPDRVFASGPNL
jgi:FAD/FMN-containing dehydrogenase